MSEEIFMIYILYYGTVEWIESQCLAALKKSNEKLLIGRFDSRDVTHLCPE